jgi:UDP-GlcNAc:undecaprenyl-phosphate GlcNAc-1-phosphate transferase
MFIYVIVALLAAVVTYLCTPVVRLVALRNGIMSPLRDRDIHTVMMPRLGGVALYIGFVVALVVASQTFWVRAIFRDTSVPWGILAGATVVLLVGVVDDVFDLNSFVKLGGQIAGALVVALWGPRLTVLPVGPTHIASEPLQVLLTVFIIVLTMNAINFVDGLDGLAAGVAAIGGAAFFLCAYWVHRNALVPDYSDLATLLMAIMVGICVGFLPHNFHPAKIFMGDSGAMLLGLILASSSIVATGQISSGLYDLASGLPTFVPIILPLVVMSLPLLDLFLAVLRRTAAGRSPFSADRGHVHHKLLDVGYSHRQAVTVMYIWTAFVAFGGVAYAFLNWLPVTVFNIIVLPAVGFLTMHPWVRQNLTTSRPEPESGATPIAAVRTPSPWIHRLHRSAASVACVSVVQCFIALYVGGVAGIYSVLTATALVLVCFGLSLLVLHFAAPAAVAYARRTLVAALLLKVIAIGTALIFLRTPAWVQPGVYWRTIVAAGLVWLLAEYITFVRQRRV